MASSSIHRIILTFTFFLLLILHTSHAQTCKSLTFKNKKTFTNCFDLPVLNAYLHWTYFPSNSTLSIAFTATPSKPGGWVAWGINPKAPIMIGTQALLGYKLPNGSATVGTYNIQSYAVAPGPIDNYKVSGLGAEFVSGNVTVFGTWVLPGTKPTEVNQVWQVGPAVGAGGVPAKHDMAAGNMISHGTLSLVEVAAAPAPSPAGTTPTTTTPAAGGGDSGSGKTGAPAPSGATEVKRGGLLCTGIVFLLGVISLFY